MIVQTTEGPVQGTAAGGVRRCLGVPYGRAARFAPAEPPPARSQVRAALAFGPVAPQLSLHGEVVGDEDRCLTLNVWWPEADLTGLPVLFFVHGGAFVTGAGSDYDGSSLAADLPAVVVTVNYRLGALGFGTASGPSPALTDLVRALSWVRDNR